MKASLQRSVLIALNVGLLVPVLIYILNCIFIRYRADDFCFYYWTQTRGVMSVVSEYYVTRTGRFASIFSIQALIMGGQQWMIALMALLLIVFWLALFGILRLLVASRQFRYVNLSASFLTSLLFIGILGGI